MSSSTELPEDVTDLEQIIIPTNTILNAKFKVGKRIGCGTYGIVARGQHITSGQEVAIKFEPKKPDNKHSDLKIEKKLYDALKGGVGIPHIHWYGDVDNFNVLVMDKLGPSLTDLLAYCGGTFTLKTVILLTVQMLRLLKFLHGKNYVHRDIKPDNFLMGTGATHNVLHLIDYGLAKEFRKKICRCTKKNCIQIETHFKHIDQKMVANWAGTLEFLPMKVHQGYNQCRRDDLQSLGYTIIYLLRGKLPWEMRDSDKTEIIIAANKIGMIKSQFSNKVLCEGLPPEFEEYFDYCDRLEFQERPNYKNLREMFLDLYGRLGFNFDFKYDWIKDKTKEELKRPAP